LTAPRVPLWENSCHDFLGLFSEPILNCQIHRAFDLVSGCRQRHDTSRENGNAGYSVSEIRFTQRSDATTRAPASYWLLLVFLLLLYANLPFVVPALDALRPAKVVAGLALVTLLAERAFARKSLEFVWPEGIMLLAFLGAGALSSLTALWPRLAAESVSGLL